MTVQAPKDAGDAGDVGAQTTGDAAAGRPEGGAEANASDSAIADAVVDAVVGVRAGLDVQPRVDTIRDVDTHLAGDADRTVDTKRPVDRTSREDGRLNDQRSNHTGDVHAASAPPSKRTLQ